jgi:WD40 repeat protein
MLDLVDVSLGDNQRYWRLRRSIQDIVVGYPDRKRLIDQLVNERLLSTSSNTGEGDADEPATVTIIHEALIENWDKLREQIVEKQEVFRQRTRFRDACNEWKKRIDIKQDESRLVNESTIRNLLSIFQNLTSIMSFIDPKKEILHSDFLLTGIRLEEAKALNTKHDIELQSDRARKFLKASIDEAGKVERRRKQIREVIAGGAMLIAIAAVVITILTLYARDRERIAKVNAQRAEQNALIGESGVLAAEAQQQIIENPVLAVNYSLQALPNSENKPRPYVSAAEFSLTQALRTIQERAYYKLSQTPLTESQVAAIHQAGTDSAQIAIGGDGLHLFLGATTSPITLTTSVSIVYGIAWGDADHLLVYGKHGIEVWEDTGRTTDHSFVRIEESQLDEPIACAAWQPNVQAIAICSGSDIAIWSAPWTNEPIVIRTGFYGFVIGARWSPDAGSHLAAYDDYGGLLYLEASNPGRAVLIPEAHDFEITDLTWSANHRYLVTAFYDGTVNIWDTTSNEAPLSIAVCEGYTGVDFVSDAQFVTWSSRGSLRQWTVDGEPVYGQNGGSDCIDDATAPTTENLIELENGNLLITRSNGSAEIRGAIERPGYVIAGHERAVVAATLSPNGQYLATGSQDGTVRIWDTQNQTLITTLRRHDGVRQDERRADVLAVQWLDNHTLVSVGEDGTLRRWAVFGDDGVAICLGETGDGFPRCVDPNSIITGRTGLVADARWLGSAKEEYLLGSVSLRDRTARLWESPSSQSVTDALILQNVITYTLAESITSAFWLDAERLLLSESSGTARLVDPQTGADIQNPVNHDSAITQIAFANGRLTTGDSTGHVYMWTADLSSVQIVHRFEQAVESLEWSGSNAYLLASGGDVVLLNTAESSLTWSWPNAGEKTYASLSPDASFVAIAFDKMLMVIERSTNQVKQRREGFTEPIQGVQWVTGEPWPHQPEDFLDLTPETDSRTSLILVWSGDGSAHLWNWQAGQDIMQLSEHPLRTGEDLPIVQASVSQDGAYILTLSESFVDAFYNEQSIMRLWRSWHNNPAALLKKASNMRTVSQE